MLLTFGKYRGATLEQVMVEDPGYILWLAENDVVPVSKAMQEEARELKYQEDLYAQTHCESDHGDWGDRD